MVTQQIITDLWGLSYLTTMYIQILWLLVYVKPFLLICYISMLITFTKINLLEQPGLKILADAKQLMSFKLLFYKLNLCYFLQVSSLCKKN